jgi:hypothetical protein
MTKEEARKVIERLMVIFNPLQGGMYHEPNYLSCWPRRPFGDHNQDFRIDFNSKGQPGWWVRWVIPGDKGHHPDIEESEAWLREKMSILSENIFLKNRLSGVKRQEKGMWTWVNLWIRVINQEDPVDEIIQIFNESWEEMEYPGSKIIYKETNMEEGIK